MSDRGDVVVRVRQIAEDRAAATAAGAALTASRAREDARDARARAAVHPLGDGSERPLRGADVLVALGVAAALRESITQADARLVSADGELAEARLVAEAARADRMAAERISDRRRAAYEAEMARRQQRTLDESALAVRELRARQ